MQLKAYRGAGKRRVRGYCAGNIPLKNCFSKLPLKKVKLNNEWVFGLADSGCTKSIVTRKFVRNFGGSEDIMGVDGRMVKTRGRGIVIIEINGVKKKLEVLVMDRMMNDIEIILGMDVISEFGGVNIGKNGIVFGVENIKSETEEKIIKEDVVKKVGGKMEKSEIKKNLCCEIDDKDFSAIFDGSFWTIKWKWRRAEPILRNKVGFYKRSLKKDVIEKFDSEISRWINEGILVPWNGDKENGVLPLMAVEQVNKDKVRPVLDYRELNEFISCHTGDEVGVCDESIRKWRRILGGRKMVDLKAAYLQIRVDESQWKHQLVKFKGKIYCLTRLGFGLCSAPRIMTKILKVVREKDKEIFEGTDSYIDDIIVDEEIVSADKVRRHLLKFGLISKDSEEVVGGRVLGMKVFEAKKGDIMFCRGNELPKIDIESKISRRDLFSICGRLVGHYPIAGWLRVICSLLKRIADGRKWSDDIGKRCTELLSKVLEEVEKNDPVKGAWFVGKSGNGKIWCDASDLALGSVLEIDGQIVEDACWLRKKSDCGHINVAELDAVLKGINLCLKWGMKKVEIMCDSKTVVNWVNNAISMHSRIKSKGAAEMLIKRRLGIISELIQEFNLEIKISLVKSEENKADRMTRVFNKWLNKLRIIEENCCGLAVEEIRRIHERNHCGVEKTMYSAKMFDENVKKEEVEDCIKNAKNASP